MAWHGMAWHGMAWHGMWCIHPCIHSSLKMYAYWSAAGPLLTDVESPFARLPDKSLEGLSGFGEVCPRGIRFHSTICGGWSNFSWLLLLPDTGRILSDIKRAW